MSKETYNYEMSNCINNGVEVYPLYFESTKTIKGKVFEGNSWYVCANNNGKEIYYNKKIGSGKVLGHKQKGKRKVTIKIEWSKAILDTYAFWSKKIDKL